jgi:hypothetical protein
LAFPYMWSKNEVIAMPQNLLAPMYRSYASFNYIHGYF